jgi:hypothetical protein
MLCLSYYCLYSLFNKTTDKGRTDSAQKMRGGMGERKGLEGRGEKWHKECMHILINKKKYISNIMKTRSY